MANTVVDLENPETSPGLTDDATANQAIAALTADDLSPADVRHNMICNLALDGVWAIGWNDILIALTPLMVYAGAKDSLIGLLNGFWCFGLLGVFLTPFITRRFRFKKWYMYGVNVPYMLMILLIGALGYFCNPLGLSKPMLLLGIVILFSLHWMFGGFCTIPGAEYMAACVPMRLRGRLMGWSLSIGAIGSLGLAKLAKWIMDTYPEPKSEGLVLLIGATICQLCYAAALFARETPTPVERSPKPWSKVMLKNAWVDKPYVRALVLYALAAVFVGPVLNFIAVYAIRKPGQHGLGLAVSIVAVAAIWQTVSRIGSGALFGKLTDRYSPKRVIPVLFLVAALGYIPVILMQNALGVCISLAITTVYAIGQAPAFVALLYSLPRPEDRAGHYTLQVLMQYIGSAIGPIAAGIICQTVPYHTVFIGFAIIALLFVPYSKYMLSLLPDKWEPGHSAHSS